MKNFTIAFLFSILSFTAYSQHTLSFNQSLILVNNTTYTVPANTTWKIINCVSTGSYTNVATLSITPPGGSATTVYLANIFTSSYASTATFDLLPMWLPAGTVIKPTGSAAMLSGIEFIVN